MKIYFNLCLIFCLILISCSREDLAPLKLASSPWPGYEPLYLARDMGFISEKSIKISELPSSNITYESFLNGSSDIGTLTLDETIKLDSMGKKARILLVMDISNGADVVLAKPNIKKLFDIKGKRILITNIPLGVYVLNRLLEKAGLKTTDVTVIQAPEDQHPRLYKEDKVDVVITFEPFASEIMKSGGKIIFDSSQIPNEIFDVLFVREDVYKARKQDLCELGKQWFRTLDYIKSERNEQALERMGKRMGSNAQGFKDMMKGLIVPDRSYHEKLFKGDNPILFTAINRISNIMLKEKLINSPVNVRSLVDPDYLDCVK